MIEKPVFNNIDQFFIILIIAIFLLGLFKRLFELLELVYFDLTRKRFFVFTILFSRKLSNEQKKLISDNFSFYKRLKPKYKEYFEHRVSKFIAHYKFVGENIEVTDEMKVLIASCYVKLTFGSRDYLTDAFESIKIYPDIYPSERDDAIFHKGEFNPLKRLMKFSWKHFEEGINVENDNLNLGLHEFTHVIHISSNRAHSVNAVVFRVTLRELFDLLSNDDLKQKLIQSSYLRDYAYENQFEFVAVVLEHFFETPREFKAQFPDIFIKVKEMINYNENHFIPS